MLSVAHVMINQRKMTIQFGGCGFAAGRREIPSAAQRDRL
jgi:hypothetical protein